ncbi:threonine/serine ThrE exporter family protein [Cellulomonas massiliensis]|uniref:threonine/serine ThrE exporter family protein n=1 Tax=Cellulomonas massiliensis TaxID=1465811 RepID=UPI0002DEED3C|nr:threonine/serine exporter family protein [Cellulomonas massiliensis]
MATAPAGVTTPSPSTTGPEGSPAPAVTVTTTAGPRPTATVTAPAPTSSPAPTVTVTASAPATTSAPTPTVTVTAPAPAVPPAVTTSELPLAMVLVAALVLALATAALVVALRRRDPRGPEDAAPTPSGSGGSPAVPASAPAAGTDAAPGVVPFLIGLGGAMLDAGAPVVQIEETLGKVADVGGAAGSSVVVLPTALVVSSPSGATTHTAAAAAGTRSLRLDQVQDVYDLADRAEREALTPEQGLARIAEVRAAPPPYRAAVRTLGYVGSSAGLALILGGGWAEVAVAAVLGGVVAGIQLVAARWSSAYQALVVLGTSFLVAVGALLASTHAGVGLYAPLIAPLVTFLPGALLTTAAIDLATRQMVAGGARLAGGAMQLVLLALGIGAAAGLVGVPATELAAAHDRTLGWWGPWLGVLVYGLGVCYHHGARRSARPWILVVLVVAYAGQVIGGLFFGGAVSGFVGALTMTPVALLASTRPSGPPMQVSFLPGFWLLVPGALGLVGVTSFFGDDQQALTTIVTAGASMVAISLGYLTGIALGSWLLRADSRVRSVLTDLRRRG